MSSCQSSESPGCSEKLKARTSLPRAGSGSLRARHHGPPQPRSPAAPPRSPAGAAPRPAPARPAEPPARRRHGASPCHQRGGEKAKKGACASRSGKTNRSQAGGRSERRGGRPGAGLRQPLPDLLRAAVAVGSRGDEIC